VKRFAFDESRFMAAHGGRKWATGGVCVCVSSVCPTQFIERQKIKNKKEILTDGKLQTKNT